MLARDALLVRASVRALSVEEDLRQQCARNPGVVVLLGTRGDERVDRPHVGRHDEEVVLLVEMTHAVGQGGADLALVLGLHHHVDRDHLPGLARVVGDAVVHEEVTERQLARVVGTFA